MLARLAGEGLRDGGGCEIRAGASAGVGSCSGAAEDIEDADVEGGAELEPLRGLVSEGMLDDMDRGVNGGWGKDTGLVVALSVAS